MNQIMLAVPVIACFLVSSPSEARTIPVPPIAAQTIQTSPSVVVTSKNPSPSSQNMAITRTVDPKSPTVSVALRANPSTGFQWMLKDMDKTLVHLKGHRYQGANNGLLGAPGMDTWTFTLDKQAFIAPHVLTVKMFYARPSAPNEGKTQEIIFVTKTQ